MKTPDEIKKGMEYLSTRDPAKKLKLWQEGIVYDWQEDAAADALALIQQLQDEKAELLKNVEQLQAERDAAVKDCGCFPCQTCEERENGDLCPMCEINGGYRSFHQWRGVQKEDSDA